MIFPVSGSLSTRTVVGATAVGIAWAIASLLVVLVLEAATSVPPVREFRREVRPRRR